MLGTLSALVTGMRKTRKPRKWSAKVVSDSLKVPVGTFASGDPRSIARAVKAAAEESPHRRSKPYASAMSYLCFYLNRGGRNLPRERRRVVEKAKDELRTLFKRD
jgi:Protein of unknown function (DUF3175)